MRAAETMEAFHLLSTQDPPVNTVLCNVFIGTYHNTFIDSSECKKKIRNQRGKFCGCGNGCGKHHQLPGCDLVSVLKHFSGGAFESLCIAVDEAFQPAVRAIGPLENARPSIHHFSK